MRLGWVMMAALAIWIGATFASRKVENDSAIARDTARVAAALERISLVKFRCADASCPVLVAGVHYSLAEPFHTRDGEPKCPRGTRMIPDGLGVSCAREVQKNGDHR